MLTAPRATPPAETAFDALARALARGDDVSAELAAGVVAAAGRTWAELVALVAAVRARRPGAPEGRP